MAIAKLTTTVTLPKLYIPGPVNISPLTYQAMNQPMMGHRGKDFAELYASIQPGLKQIIGTTRPVYLAPSSAWGVMEAAIRNLTQKKVLNLCCGAFSDKWYDVALRCGIPAEKIQEEWGNYIKPDEVRSKLAEGGFDVVTLVHNETSTGVMNDVAAIAKVVKEFPDVLLVVDTVSSLSAVPVKMDEWGVDVIIAGVQKAFALPPGLNIFAISEAALERAKSTPDRGYYFDFLEFEKHAINNNTPTTPAISIIYGLQHQVRGMLAEGLENRYERHAFLNAMVHNWVAANGFKHFAPYGYQSKSLTAISNNREIDVPAYIEAIRAKHNILINGGYGKAKGITFRVSNMGDETVETMSEVLEAMSDILPGFI
ncbi:pyridoxal-phosphate-dependent aminotransferase family protein [Persicirhabdus sediminis]|nr:alanine--glyoxylate aminotransferase family protein [Persicirhabdus sediminis]